MSRFNAILVVLLGFSVSPLLMGMDNKKLKGTGGLVLSGSDIARILVAEGFNGAGYICGLGGLYTFAQAEKDYTSGTALLVASGASFLVSQYIAGRWNYAPKQKKIAMFERVKFKTFEVNKQDWLNRE